MLLKPEQHMRIAQGFYKASQDKKVEPTKRLEFRGQAKRFRALANMAAKLENQKKTEA